MSAQPRPQSSAGADARSLGTENHCFPNEGLEPRGHNGPFERFRGADQPAGDPVSVEGAKTRKRNGPGRLVPRPLPEARSPFRLGLPALPCRGCNALVAHHVSKKEAWQSHRVRGAAKTRWRMGPVILNGHYDGRVILHSSRNLFLRVIGEKPMISDRCGICFGARNIGAGHAGRAAPSAGGHDHASPHGMRRW